MIIVFHLLLKLCARSLSLPCVLGGWNEGLAAVDFSITIFLLMFLNTNICNHF